MTRDLENELTIPTFMQECPRRGTFQGETAKHEGSSGKSQVLPLGIAILANRLKGLYPSQRAFGNDQLGKVGFQNKACSLKSLRTGRAFDEGGLHLPTPKANERQQTYSGGLDLCDVIVPTVPLNAPSSHLNGAPNTLKMQGKRWRP